jgi:hypothetical protein
VKPLLSLVLPFAVAVPFFGGHHGLTRPDLQRDLLRQMNGSPAGKITSRVDCRVAGATNRYLCDLTSLRGTHARAIVYVSGSSWRAEWAPLSG